MIELEYFNIVNFTDQVTYKLAPKMVCYYIRIAVAVVYMQCVLFNKQQ